MEFWIVPWRWNPSYNSVSTDLFTYIANLQWQQTLQRWRLSTLGLYHLQLHASLSAIHLAVCARLIWHNIGYSPNSQSVSYNEGSLPCGFSMILLLPYTLYTFLCCHIIYALWELMAVWKLFLSRTFKDNLKSQLILHYLHNNFLQAKKEAVICCVHSKVCQ